MVPYWKLQSLMTDEKQPECRFCGLPLTETFVDLGMSPPCENFLTADQLNCVEHLDRKSTRLNSSHTDISRMPSSA